MEEAGMMEVVKSINRVSDIKTSEQIVEQLIPALWPRLQQTLENIPDTEPSEKHMRPHHEILEELVTGVRAINSRMRDLEPDLLDREQVYKRRRMRRIHPRMLEEMTMIVSEEGGGPLQLLMLAGLYREDLPWLAEVLTEAYREIRDGNPDSAERTLTRLRRMMKHMMHSKMFFDLSGGSKELMMLAEELPMILEMAMHRMIPERHPSEDRDE